MNARVGYAALVLTLTLAACSSPDDQRTGDMTGDGVRAARADIDEATAAALDSANAAYRNRDYEAALRHYRIAVDRREDLAAGWFGIYMAQLALGNEEEAEAAMQQARRLAPDASLIHPDPDRPVPADHPATESP